MPPTAVLKLPVVSLKSAGHSASSTDCRVLVAGGIAKEGPVTDGRVVVAGGVAKERERSNWPC